MEPLLFAARAVQFAATISLVGVFVFQCLIVAPPGRLVRQFSRLAWASIGLALVSGACWLAAVAAAMSAAPLIDALASGAWATVLARTRFGSDWLLRLGLIALIALCLVARRRWTGLFVAALLLTTLAWAGHGAATPGRSGDLHLAADVLHLLAAGLWLGTLVPFALLLAAARDERSLGWAATVRTATRRFSLLAMGSVAVLLLTGLVNTWFLAGSIPALVGTEYGSLLLTKLVLFAALLAIGAVNLLRLAPRLAGSNGALFRTLLWLRRNALGEAIIGFVILAIVGALGASPPGAHSEPHWPFAFRIELSALSPRDAVVLKVVIVVAGICAVAATAEAAAGHYRRTGVWALGLAVCLLIGWAPLQPAVERAYPTSFAVPAEPYAAPSIVRGAALYGENCALCHGVGGRGDGPAAAGMRIRPADLTAHLFAHTAGDLFWRVSHGGEGGAMPGFAEVMTTGQRWDVVNFVRARAAGILAQRVGPQVGDDASLEFPDFPFSTGGQQETLAEVLKAGPVLLVLCEHPAPFGRLGALTVSRATLGRAKLSLVVVETKPSEPDGAAPSRFVVDVPPDLRAALALFRSPDDGGETEFLLDRSFRVRARWTARDLADVATLVADGERIAHTEVPAPAHIGHSH